MKNLDKYNKLLYLALTIYIIISIFLQIHHMSSAYINLINPICWFLLTVGAFSISAKEGRRLKYRKDKTQLVLISVMIYLVIYFLSGMVFGFTKSPYSHRIFMIIKNLFTFVSVIIFQEIIRSTLISTNKLKWYKSVYVVILFTLIDLNFTNFSMHFIDLKTIFEYICSIVVPTIFRNILLTYLITNGGIGCTLSYKVPIMISNLIMPLFPNLDWFMTAFLEIILIMVIFLQINNFTEQKENRRLRKRKYKKATVGQLIFLCAIIISISFIAGFFHYMPVAIMSNSMYKLIERGDVVVIEKLDKKKKETLKVNDIISYQLDGSCIVHRIIKINKINDNEYYYITKGDNNKKEDLNPVSIDQINGKVLIRIPKIGYPSVILSEILSKTKPNVETG